MEVYLSEFINWKLYEFKKINELGTSTFRYYFKGKIVNLKNKRVSSNEVCYMFKLMDDTGIVELNYSLSKYSPKFEMLRQLQLGISVFVYSNVVCRVSGIRAWKLQIHSKNLESKIEATVSEPEQIPCPGFGSDNIVPLSLVNDFKDGAFVNVLVAIQWKEEFEIFNNETTKSLPKQTIHVRDISGSAMIVLIGESQVKSALSWNNETSM